LAGLLAGCIEPNRPSINEDGDGDATVGDGDVGFEIVACDGCVFARACHADGELNGANPCEVCDVQRSVDGWSAVLESKPCEDSDPCTDSGVCQAGACVAPPPRDCTNLPECVACNAECEQVVAPNTCFIDGACVGQRMGPAGDNCLVCDPLTNQTAWSPTKAGCDDGDPCTYEDTCNDGVCAGQDNTCADVFTCTLDFCDGGQCLHQVARDTCLVNNQCFAIDTGPPGDPCRTCQPSVSTTTLTPAQGASCDDQYACTMVSSCGSDGSCSGELSDIDKEPNDSLDTAQDVGIVAAGGFPSGTVQANIVGNDLDTFRWGMTFTNGGLAFSPSARVAFAAATGYELCIYARCGQVSTSSFAPVVVCQSLSFSSDLDNHTRGCCKAFDGGVTARVSMAATCAGTVVQGFGYARVRSFDDADAANCGGYSLEWGVGD